MTERPPRFVRKQVLKNGEPGVRFEEKTETKPELKLESRPYQMGWEHYLADAVWAEDVDNQ